MIKKILGVIAMAVLFSRPVFSADTYTSGDMVLTKPAKASLNWDGKINGNFDILVASVGVKASSQTWSGQNSFLSKVGIFGSTVSAYGLAISTTASISGKLTTTVASDILDWTASGYTSTIFGSHNGAMSGDDGFGIYDKSNTWNGRLDLGIIYGPQLHGKGAIGAPLLGLNDSTPQYAFDVTGGGHFTSSMTVDAGIYGDLTGNVIGNVTGSASLNVLKSGDTMTGQLTLSGSSLTVTGGLIEVNGSGTTDIVIKDRASVVGGWRIRQGDATVDDLVFGSGNFNQYLSLSPTTGVTIPGSSFSVGSAGNLFSVVSGSVAVGAAAGTFRSKIYNTSQFVNDVTASNNYIGFYKDTTPSYVASIGISNPGVASLDTALIFARYSGGWVEQMRIASGGNVGIGTTAPTYKLQVVGPVGVSGGIDASSITIGGVSQTVGYPGVAVSSTSQATGIVLPNGSTNFSVAVATTTATAKGGRPALLLWVVSIANAGTTGHATCQMSLNSVPITDSRHRLGIAANEDDGSFSGHTLITTSTAGTNTLMLHCNGDNASFTASTPHLTYIEY